MAARAGCSRLALLVRGGGGGRQAPQLLARARARHLALIRPLCCSSVCHKEVVEKPDASVDTEVKTKKVGDIGQYFHPTDLDKWILVTTEMYKSKEEVPEEVRFATMFKARDLMRVRISICMIAFCMFASAYMMYQGREVMRKGQTLTMQGDLYSIQLRRQGIQEETEALMKKIAAKKAAAGGSS